MSNARLITTAEAVKDALNEADLSQSFEAVRKWIPRWTREQLSTLRVTVVAKGYETIGSSRGSNWEDHLIEVGVQKALAVGQEDAEGDALAYLFDEIGGTLQGPDTEFGGAFWMSTENVNPDPFWVQSHLKDMHVLTLAARFRFRTDVDR